MSLNDLVRKTFKYLHMSCSAHCTSSIIFPTIEARFETTIYIVYLCYSCFFVKIIPTSELLVTDQFSTSLNVEVQKITLHLPSLKKIILASQLTYLFSILSHGISKIILYLSFDIIIGYR